MKQFCRKTIALLLAVLILFGTCETGVVNAVDEIDKALNPAERIALTVPEQFRDGENRFFFAQTDWSISEKSNEKLYVPIQRAGDLDSEAVVTIKVIDVTSKHDVNYTVEVYKEDVEPETYIADMSIVELAQNAEYQTEIELGDENDMGQLIHDAGGAEMVDAEGNVIANVTATPLDENGDPVSETEAAADESEEEPAAVNPGEAEEGGTGSFTFETASPGPKSLMNARNAFTGMTSDRQELAGNDPLGALASNNTMTEDEFNQEMADAVEDGYPGIEYTLHFNAGEEAKFLVITPMYSDAAEGDAQIILMLKNPSEGWAIGEDVNPASVIIFDEDEAEPVTVSMAASTVTAENGKAVITVTRSGRINAIKGVMLSSWDGSAKEGDEYSGVGAKLYFPMGITSRTIEIPVYHGTEDKDFYLTITELDDEEIGTATTHVLIPKATADGELMDADAGSYRVGGRPLVGPIKLQNTAANFYSGSGNTWEGEKQPVLATSTNKEETSCLHIPSSMLGGKAYDGMYLEYWGFLNWCDADFRLVRWTKDSGGNWITDRAHVNYFDDGGTHADNHWLSCYWTDVNPPLDVTIEAANVDNEGAVGTDSYVTMHVQGVYMIKRQFDVKVEPAEVKPLIGVEDSYVLKNYESVMLDTAIYSTGTYWTGDSFSVSATNARSPLRLVGLEAKTTDNKWTRIATLDGITTTAEVTLDVDTINAFSDRNIISWAKNGSVERGTSYKGSITVRPVFDYINTTVELKHSPNGTLLMTAPAPSVLWDFSKEDIQQRMGTIWSSQVSYARSGNSYTTFTAGGNDPYISVETPNLNADNVKWVKLRVKNHSSATRLQLFVSIGSAGRSIGNTRQDITISANDSAFQEYVVPITNSNWSGEVKWLRLDPLDACNSGDKIDIQYVAFFPDEASARAYQFGSAAATTSAAGSYTYHLGDRLTFTSTVSDQGQLNNMKPDGITYELRKFSETGIVKDWVDVHYTNGSKTMALMGTDVANDVVDRPHYTITPTFTEKGNCVSVEVSKAALEYLDTSKGFLANYVSRVEDGESWVYTVQENVLSNVPVGLEAYTNDSAGSAWIVWTMASGTMYYGNSITFRTGEIKAANRVKLQIYSMSTGSMLSDDGHGELMDDLPPFLTYATVSGTVVTSTYNLATDHSAEDLLLAKNAYVCFGDYAAWTDEDGHFELPAFVAMRGGAICYTVTYNGVVNIVTATIPAAGAPTSEKTTLAGETVEAVTANVGTVRVESVPEDGIHVISATADQVGILPGVINAMPLNGKSLTVSVQIQTDATYELNGTTTTENIQDVTLYFVDQYTGEIHGQYSSTVPADQQGTGNRWTWELNKDENGNSLGTGTFTLTIDQFDPTKPEAYTYGDALMVQIVTDKKLALSAFADQLMYYDPVSTGFCVISDPNYKPQIFQYNVDNVAELLGVTPQTDEDGNLLDGDTNYSFGSFPYIGQINIALNTLTKVYSSSFMSEEARMLKRDLAAIGDDSLDTFTDLEDIEGLGDDVDLADYGTSEAAGSGKTYNGQFSAFFEITENIYGGVRFMFGVVYSYGGGKGYEKQKNPYAILDYKYDQWVRSMSKTDDAFFDPTVPELIYDGKRTTVEQDANSFGGAYFKFSAFAGLYFDFGYVEESTEQTDAEGNTVYEKSHDMIYMGVGGFLGFAGNMGYTWPFMLGPIPAYFNAEAGLNVTFFLGSEGNPNITLEHMQETDEIKGQDFNLYFEIKGRIFVSATLGVGSYKCMGLRAVATVAFEFGYSPEITKWCSDMFDSDWGYVTEAGFAGYIDLIVTSIELYSATWPLPLADGFLYYFQEARRANKCISYVENGITDKNGSESAQETAKEKIDALRAVLDTNSDVDTIMEMTTDLKDYAYDNDIIDWVTKNTIEMNKQAGMIGAPINASLQDDNNGSGIRYHTNGHVNSQWVSEDGELMAAYQAVRSKEIMKDAYAQPSTKIVGIGDNRFLMVFLDDDPSRDNVMAAQLKWTIYDAANDTFTLPEVVQNDRTADGKPSLVDAGDKVVLSWASPTDAKYTALKNAVAEEIGSDNSALIQEALEEDPARVMSTFDIFTVEFHKSSRRFGSITQLTDDDWYDDYPQAVYDNKTGDYLVMYYKTAQDDSKYTDSGDKLQDIVAASPDPEKTYSVICYMLYNNQTDAADIDGLTHPAGWARDYLFEKETALATVEERTAFLDAYKGQRFLASPILTEDGKYADPPISDLTVAPGCDGIGVYAFTVDMDFNLNTTEDRELYVESYDFATHSTYVPIRVAGSATVTSEQYDSNAKEFVTITSTRQVDVSAPKLVRNGDSTFLFWREDGETLKYLNITEMMSAKVAAVSDPDDNTESDWANAVMPDGTFATDAATGVPYAPRTQRVDFGSVLTDDAIHITDYEIICDEDDNLYVVWADTVTSNVTNEIGETRPVAAQEIFASAMIHQGQQKESGTDSSGETGTAQTVRWSKPYRMTRDNTFNDGLALTLDSDGGLIIVHNQWSKKVAQDEDEMMRLINEGKIGVTQDKDGNLYAASLEYNSPVSLMVTRCDQVGSLEATRFAFSDSNPVAGQTVAVTATIENVGLTDAEGMDVTFYENRNGVQGEEIYHVTSSDPVTVNTAKYATFYWTVPDGGPEGYRIEAVIREKREDGGYYDAISSCSDPFAASPAYVLGVTDVKQDGDKFNVSYAVVNNGNADAGSGTRVELRLAGLYGNLSDDRYGNLDSDVLFSQDITSKLKAKAAETVAEENFGRASVTHGTAYTDSQLVTIPASVFRYCGYDAIQVVLTDQNGNVIEESSQYLVRQAEPMNLELNGGNVINLSPDATCRAVLDYNTNVFIETGTVVYSVDDPTIAVVDDKGNVTGLADGTTTLTATLLPSGASVSIQVNVGSGRENPFTDVEEGKFYYEPVLWAYYHDPQIATGTSKTKFSPNNPCTRAQIVTFLWRAAGCPEPETTENPFEDVKESKYYYKAVLWAAETGVTLGTSKTKFSPDAGCTRAQAVTFLWRFAGKPEPTASTNPFEDVPEGAYYTKAVLWAAETGVTLGTSKTKFSPNKRCTRGEIVTFLWRYMRE